MKNYHQQQRQAVFNNHIQFYFKICNSGSSVVICTGMDSFPWVEIFLSCLYKTYSMCLSVPEWWQLEFLRLCFQNNCENQYFSRSQFSTLFFFFFLKCNRKRNYVEIECCVLFSSLFCLSHRYLILNCALQLYLWCFTRFISSTFLDCLLIIITNYTLKTQMLLCIAWPASAG